MIDVFEAAVALRDNFVRENGRNASLAFLRAGVLGAADTLSTVRDGAIDPQPRERTYTKRRPMRRDQQRRDLRQHFLDNPGIDFHISALDALYEKRTHLDADLHLLRQEGVVVAGWRGKGYHQLRDGVQDPAVKMRTST